VVATVVTDLIVVVVVTFEVATRSSSKLATKLDIMQAPLTIHDHSIMGIKGVQKTIKLNQTVSSGSRIKSSIQFMIYQCDSVRLGGSI
jgi:hypothetical protein